ncbi:MAG TPA: helix-turn-helix transcriptional regulator [Saprospiraceae bacterium]|nr:helix-turn-helix transcriptional regulator [Saprospiraceae bacterium]HPI08967.1 helix-turn-helix transcriptional regulator [Saprospiraceae bacterium]
MPLTQLPEKIRAIRRLLHLRQHDMAERLGISIEAYSKMERGKTRLHLERLQQITGIFGMETTQMMTLNLEELLPLLREKKNPAHFPVSP